MLPILGSSYIVIAGTDTVNFDRSIRGNYDPKTLGMFVDEEVLR